MDNKTKQELLEEIEGAIGAVDDFGSVEVYVNGGKVTQITVRKIKKTSIDIPQIQEIGTQEKKDYSNNNPTNFFTVRARFRRSS